MIQQNIVSLTDASLVCARKYQQKDDKSKKRNRKFGIDGWFNKRSDKKKISWAVIDEVKQSYSSL